MSDSKVAWVSEATSSRATLLSQYQHEDSCTPSSTPVHHRSVRHDRQSLARAADPSGAQISDAELVRRQSRPQLLAPNGGLSVGWTYPGFVDGCDLGQVGQARADAAVAGGRSSSCCSRGWYRSAGAYARKRTAPATPVHASSGRAKPRQQQSKGL